PFGRGNKQPIFQTQGVREIEESTTLGNHLRVTLKQGRAPARPGIGFGLAEYQRKIRKKAFDICFTIHANQANGRDELQLNIKDIKLRK
ncbi:MAG: single-stranded-DNA-specific exonuclease RecJ, partial [Bacteroidota bacterium]